ncbi:MAG: TRAP transporter small permease [Bacillota bacterium]
MNVFVTAGKVLDWFSRFMTILSVGIMSVIVTAQVFFRYFLKNPIFWAEELARYALVWMTFIGAAVALRQGMLANMDLIVGKLPAKMRRGVFTIVSLLNIVLLGFLFYYSIKLVGEPSVLSQKSPAMGIPMSYVYLGMPIGLFLLILQSLIGLFNDLAGKGGNN